MPRIQTRTIETTSDAARPLLEEVVGLAGGRLLNLHTTMASSPAVLATYLGARKAVMEHRPLDGKTGAAVMLTVANVTGSEYTQAVNAQVAARVGWSVEETIELRSGAAADQKLQALLTLAREAAANTGLVDDATWRAAQAAGWSDDELADTFAYIALALYVDLWSRYADLELDVPAAPAVAR